MSNYIPGDSSPSIETNLNTLKSTIGETQRNVDVVINADGRKYQVTFYNITQSNFDQIVTIDKIADIMKTTLLLRVGEKYKAIDIYKDSVKLRDENGKEKDIAATNPGVIQNKLDQLQYLVSSVNASSSNQNKEDTILHRFTTPAQSGSQNNSLTEQDYKYFEDNKVPKEVVDKYAGSNYENLIKKTERLNELLKKSNRIYEQLVKQKTTTDKSPPESKTIQASISVVTHPSSKPAETNLDLINNIFQDSTKREENKEKIIELADQLNENERDLLSSELNEYIKKEYSIVSYFKDKEEVKQMFETKYDLS